MTVLATFTVDLLVNPTNLTSSHPPANTMTDRITSTQHQDSRCLVDTNSQHLKAII